ncbi:MAG: sigma 54-interacting transcriptional regulator [Thermodesulfobacteriota bacterium]|nr:sigma 54-interacting transcriptional regulator [Thermodesulfobacteriota bacterium]
MGFTSIYAAERLLESFFRISTLITAPLSVDDILQNILDEVVETMGFDRGIICLLDDEKENLVTKVVKNYSPEEVKRAFSSHLNLKKHDCFETKVVKDGHYIVLEDSKKDPRVTETDRKISKIYKRGSTFYAALQVEDSVVGMISLWSRGKSKFSPEAVNILLTFANQISVVIHSAGLFEDNRDKIKMLIRLQEAGSQLNTCDTLDRMHEIFIDSALKIGKAERALLYFIDTEKDKFLISDGSEIFVDKENKYSSKMKGSIIERALDREAIIVRDPVQSNKAIPVFEDYPVEMAIPLKIRDKFKGVLCLGKKGVAFTRDQKNILDILVISAAASYDNAIMHSMLSLEAKSLKTEVETLKEREDKLLGFHDIVGHSGKMKEIFRVIREVAGHDTSILVQGESGTGKELIARAIHRQSNRKSKHFVDVNCAAIPGTLLESELFGYEAGAFTDARKRKLGLLEYASGGTILLDEIGEMNLSIQAKFLRMLEDGYIRRLGGTDNISINVRFIFSTNRDLSHMVAEGAFREDLFYRVSVVPINIPPLRERGEDAIILANHYIAEFNNKFNKKVKGFSEKSEEILKQYSWPGNVRELKNIIERIMIMQNVRGVITPDNLPAEISEEAPKNSIGLQLDDSLSLDSAYPVDYKVLINSVTNTFRNRILSKALELSKGNKTAAAKRLGISRYALIRELKKLELN